MNTKIISAILVLAFASLACGISGIKIPKPPTPGPTVTDKIEIKTPDAKAVSLRLSFGAGDLKIQAGAKQLVEGTATYNYPAFKPEVAISGSNIEVKMSEADFNAMPNFKDSKNVWDLKLGDTPMDLSIAAGAYQGTFDFGGLALTSLTIKDGAADAKISFSKENAAEMTTLHYESGASNIKMSGLANANFSLLDFSAGAGDYTLDFSGTLKRDAAAKIKSGLSNMIIVIPENVNAVVTVNSGASNVNAAPGWTQNGSVYKQTGEGFTLTISVEIGAGNLTLTH